MRFWRRGLLKERSGNTAMIFAVLAPVLVLLGGGAVDVTNASMRQSNLQQAADAAATGAVARNSPGFQYALNTVGPGPIPDSVTETNAQAIFSANWRASGDTAPTAISGNACGGATLVCKQGTAVMSSVQVSGTFTPSFLGLMGLKKIALSATSKSTANIPTYINYYIIVDASQSMGIASTQTDMDTLYSRVVKYGNASEPYQPGCVFGCHVQGDTSSITGISNSIQPYTNEDLAHNSSYGSYVTLRIDAAKSAIVGIIEDAKAAAGSVQNIKFALYTMSDDPTGAGNIRTVANLSSNYDGQGGLVSLASEIDLGNNTKAGVGDSDLYHQLTSFAGTLPANGTGLSAASPLNYVFVVTDGMVDAPASANVSGAGVGCGYGHCVMAFDPKSCNALKAVASVGVLYTTYNEIFNQDSPAKGPEGNYLGLVNPFVGSIAPNLLKCASSSSLYFEASDGPDIQAKMGQLFASTLKTARLTQ